MSKNYSFARFEDTMVYSAQCEVTGEPFRVEVPIDQWFSWRSGELIQNAMPQLSSDQREFLISGMTPAEWNRTFGNDSTDDTPVETQITDLTVLESADGFYVGRMIKHLPDCPCCDGLTAQPYDRASEYYQYRRHAESMLITLKKIHENPE